MEMERIYYWFPSSGSALRDRDKGGIPYSLSVDLACSYVCIDRAAVQPDDVACDF